MHFEKCMIFVLFFVFRVGCYFEEESTERQVQTLRIILKHCPDTVCWKITKLLVSQLTKEQLQQTNREFIYFLYKWQSGKMMMIMPISKKVSINLII